MVILTIILDKTYCNDNNNEIYPYFPLQLSSSLQITASLIDKDNEYPPRIRTMKFYYDYTNKRARIDIDEGYEAKKTYIRRYDNDEEYMIRPLPIDDCKYSYLGEIMPYPDIPATFVRKEMITTINGNYHHHHHHHYYYYYYCFYYYWYHDYYYYHC